MYRREYPDLPGMFDARFHQYNQPSLVRELRASWAPCLLGLALALAGAGALAWNEGRAVRTARALEEGLREVTVPETTSVVFEENQGKLVLVAGALAVPDPLTDETYGISVRAAKLRKVVQVYQWFETEDQRPTSQDDQGDPHDHEKTYSYDTDWFDYHIESSSFANTLGHHNPHLDEWPANSTLVSNPRVKIGSYLLGSALTDQFTSFTGFTSDSARPRGEGVRVYAGLYYHSNNLWQPEVGDYRVQFSYSGREGEEHTVVGRQSGREVRPYTTEGGEVLAILQEGLRGPMEVFRTEQHTNRTTTWLYRLAGWLAVFLGLNLLGSVLSLALDLHPRLRRLLALGSTSLPLSVSITVSLGTIGGAWLVHRPMVGLMLLLLSAAPYVVPVARLVLGRSGEPPHRP